MNKIIKFLLVLCFVLTIVGCKKEEKAIQKIDIQSSTAKLIENVYHSFNGYNIKVNAILVLEKYENNEIITLYSTSLYSDTLNRVIIGSNHEGIPSNLTGAYNICLKVNQEVNEYLINDYNEYSSVKRYSYSYDKDTYNDFTLLQFESIQEADQEYNIESIDDLKEAYKGTKSAYALYLIKTDENMNTLEEVLDMTYDSYEYILLEKGKTYTLTSTLSGKEHKIDYTIKDDDAYVVVGIKNDSMKINIYDGTLKSFHLDLKDKDYKLEYKETSINIYVDEDSYIFE